MKFFVTGSSQGIGTETAAQLIAHGHEVVAHARNPERAEATWKALPQALAVVVGDLESIEETKALAETAGELGPYTAIVHNAGIGGNIPHRSVTKDGLEKIFQVNVLGPYLLTCLMEPPERLIYLTSGLEAQGKADFEDPLYERKAWKGMQAYSDSKLFDVMLAFAVARRWPQVLSNAVDPGWIKTRMGGPGAPDPLPLGAETQVWLATSNDPAALVTGRYFKHLQELRANPAAYEEANQEALLSLCSRLTGVPFPA